MKILASRKEKKSDFKSLKVYPVFAHKMTPFRLKNASFNTTVILPVKDVCFWSRWKAPDGAFCSQINC